jgi:hypothetical protein
MNFKKAIVETRKNYSSRPKNHMEYDKIERPSWCPPQFEELFENQDVLFAEGRVVWCTTIQANGNLFSPGPYDLPAVILYSLDERIDSNPKLIQQVALGLYSIKGQQTDQDLQEFSDMLRSERTQKWKVPVPPRISKNIQCFYTTALIVRKHLPYGYLRRGPYPFLVCPEKTNVGTILPARYWSKRFVKDYW